MRMEKLAGSNQILLKDASPDPSLILLTHRAPASVASFEFLQSSVSQTVM